MLTLKVYIFNVPYILKLSTFIDIRIFGINLRNPYLST